MLMLGEVGSLYDSCVMINGLCVTLCESVVKMHMLNGVILMLLFGWETATDHVLRSS